MPIESVACSEGRIPVLRQGDGPALLLLHGWALDHRMWTPQIDDLSRDFMVLAPDRRGFGLNRMSPDLDRELDDLDALRAHFSLDRMHLLGMSQGGRLALRYAHARPGALDRLILHGAPLDGFQPLPNGGDAIPLADYSKLARNGRMDDVRQLWCDHALMTLPDDRTDLRSLIVGILVDYRGDDLLSPEGTGPPCNLAARLDEITVPASILIGEDDSRWLHLVAEALAYGLPAAGKVVLRDGGHLVNLTNPHAYNAAIRSFLLAA